MLTNRINSLSESLTLQITNLAKTLKSEGKDILSFSAGEPDFDTPEIVKKAAINAIENGCSKYTPVAGTNEVLEAISRKFKRDNALSYSPSQIITNVGAKHSLFNIIQCLIQEGDEVIFSSPYWVSYPEMIKFAGGIPVVIETDEECGFKIKAEILKEKITQNTKLIILNSPSNPTGAIYTRSEIKAIGEVLEGSDILIASDEIYEKIIYDKPFVSVASVSDDLYKRTITINGLSKCAAMTGWRFGYIASCIDELNKAIRKLQSQSTSNISSIAQAAAIPVLLGKADDEIEIMKEAFQKRRDLAVKQLGQIDKISVLSPDGAFYLFIKIKEVENDSVKFCSKLLSKEGVALVPGIGFGSEGYVRMSFATDEISIVQGIQRIAKFVKEYKG